MALKGNLKDFNVTQLFNLVNLARKTGALTIEGRDKRAEVCFKDGRLVYASLNGQAPGLIGLLEKAGKISPEQSSMIRARSTTSADKELGLLLLNAGYVTQDDIVRSIRDHTLDVVYLLFTWTDGSFTFEPNKLPSEGTITIPINLENIIMEGSRRVKEYEMLQDELPDLDLALKFTERPDARLRGINLTGEEWRVVSFINPRNTIRQIAKANSMSDFKMRRIVYGLLSAGLVELVIPEGPKTIVTATEVAAPPPVKRSLILRLIDKVKRM
ncbi:MAG: DUF4388 domain-containing protein [Anaerolineae bacterium]|nr:DUF4388 domain-containing protein [Anaerolineae bacterium]